MSIANVSTPIETTDPVNATILSVSEDRIQGFVADPFSEIARLSGIELSTVLDRIAAMLRAGTIRRVRQTLMATNLAPGALVAWRVPEEKLSAAFEWMHENDPFTGHAVIRSTDQKIPGARFRLWTTLKVPQPYSMDAHCRLLMNFTGAEEYKLMPAKRLFALGVGHVRRRGLAPGSKADALAEPHDPRLIELSENEWRVLTELKRELNADEIRPDVFHHRAEAAGMSFDEFCAVAQSLNDRKVIGRFSTFLEHYKPNAAGERVTKFNALFHWAVPVGREIEAGQQVGRFHVMTHAYWREGGPDFGNVNIMGVAHGTDKEMVLTHKRAIDAHLAEVGIPVNYTNLFWGGRSEIKPSEISPVEYEKWRRGVGVDPAALRG